MPSSTAIAGRWPTPTPATPRPSCCARTAASCAWRRVGRSSACSRTRATRATPLRCGPETGWPSTPTVWWRPVGRGARWARPGSWPPSARCAASPRPRRRAPCWTPRWISPGAARWTTTPPWSSWTLPHEEERLIQNVRYALRQLVRAPGYAAVALLTLAIGIGANTAIFSLIEAALLRGLPFHEPKSLVALWERNPRNGNPRNQVSPASFTRWQERSRSFVSVAAYVPWPTTIAGADDAVRVRMGVVTPRFFETFGVA